MTDTEKKRRRLAGANLAAAAHLAHKANESCIVAYWLQHMHGDDVSFHVKNAKDALKEVADLFGCDLVERDDA